MVDARVEKGKTACLKKLDRAKIQSQYRQRSAVRKKIGLGILGFLICAGVTSVTRLLIDGIMIAIGSSGGSYGGSYIVAFGAAYLVYDGFENDQIDVQAHCVPKVRRNDEI